MAKLSRANKALPATSERALHTLGRDIAIARKRRRIPQRLMAQRMMVSLDTLQRLEKGDSGVSIGVVATALWVLGLVGHLSELASPDRDAVGKTEELHRLPTKTHAPNLGQQLDF